jgi:hypothetical protein
VIRKEGSEELVFQSSRPEEPEIEPDSAGV